MNHRLFILPIVLAVYVPIALAQRTNLVGTKWVLQYTTGKQNSTDYSEYAKITLANGRKATFDNGETGHWSLKGTKLTIENDSSDTTAVHYVEVTIRGTIATGSAVLGMTSQVPYWCRLVRQTTAPLTPRGSATSTNQNRSWPKFWLEFRAALNKRDKETLKQMMSSPFAVNCTLEGQPDSAEQWLNKVDERYWRKLQKIMVSGTKSWNSTGRPRRVTNGDAEDLQLFEFGADGRWRWLGCACYEC